MAYTAQQITYFHQRTREIYPELLRQPTLPVLTDVIYSGYNEEVNGFTYVLKSAAGYVITVHLWCCPETLEIVCSCDY
jgi:hypothetical protein